MIAMSEGTQAASNQGYCAESSAGMAGCVGAGGVLLAVLPPIAWSLQTMVRACKRHLHGSWKNAPGCSKGETVYSHKMLQIPCFLFADLKFWLCSCYVMLNVRSPEQFSLRLLILIWKSHKGMMGSLTISQFLLERKTLRNLSHLDISAVQFWSACRELG